MPPPQVVAAAAMPTPNSAPLTEWVTSLLDSTEVMAENMGLGRCLIVQREEGEVPKGVEGAFVSLVGKHQSMRVGILSYPQHNQTLAKTILASDEDLEAETVHDMVREMANILAGQVKGEMANKTNGVSLTLPKAMYYEDVPPEARAIAHVTIGEVPVVLVVVPGDTSS
jgi:hypothetical protein